MNTGATMLLDRVRAATADEYTIDRELGRGGMAAVYLARDIALQRRVAIKVMLPDLIDVEGIEERFVIEARTAAHLDHPGIVTVYSVKQRAGLLFIVMKYIEGRTLDSVLEGDQPLDVPIVTSIVSQVADALHFAHGEGVVHRDVKPSNILIDTRGRPVVTDFGIAKISSGRALTVTGAMIGTPAYMSPEQCRGLPATTASDQYSLGVMAYEMLARRLPFEGTLFELIHAHSDTAPPPLSELVPGIDPELEKTVLQMLAKNPRDRLPSLSDVSRRIAQLGGPRRNSSEVQESIAALAKIQDKKAPRRPQSSIDISGAATEVATTPAPGLVITPADPAIEVGESVQMRVSESSGASLAGVKITWKSEDPSIAVVDATGLVTGKSVGLAKVSASGGMAFGRIAVNVRAASVDALVVTPQNPEIETDNELQLVAMALDARGNTVLGQAIHWSSSDVAVCAVSQQGRAIGTKPGRAEITATCGGVTGTAHVKVRPPAVERVVVEPHDPGIEVEEKLRVTASVFGPFDRVLRGRTVTWRSSAPAIATVTPDGLIEGISAGSVAIIATCEGKEGIASVTVRNQPVVAVRLQPARLQLEVGRSMQLQGVAVDRGGRSVAGSSLEWLSDDDEIAMIDASGKVHAVREGKTTVRAISGDVTSAIEVTIVPRPAAQVRIEAHPPELRVGAFLTLDATVLDGEGVSLPDRVVAWTSSDPAVVTVTADGTCEAKKAGSVRITATCEKARGTTKLSVPVVPVAAPLTPDDEPATVIIDKATLPQMPPLKPPPPPPPPTKSAPPPVPPRAAKTEAPPAAPPPQPATRPISPPPSVSAPSRVPERKSNRGAMIGGAAVVLIAATALSISLFNNDGNESGVGPIDSLPVVVPGQTGAAGNVPVIEPPAGPTGATSATGSPGATGSTGTTAATGGAAPTGNTGRTNPPPTGATGSTGTTGRGSTGGTTGGQTGGRGAGGTTGATGATAGAAGGGAATPPESTEAERRRADSIARARRVTDSINAARRAADSAANAMRQLLCGSSSTAERALNDALGGDPGANLTRLYVPRDQADTQEKTALVRAINGARNLNAASGVVRNEAAGDACDWIVTVQLRWNDGLGRPGRRAMELRMRLEASGSQVRVARLFGGRSQ